MSMGTGVPGTSQDGMPPVRRFRRVRSLFRFVEWLLVKVLRRRLQSRRGLVVLVLLSGGLATIVAIGGVIGLAYSETPGFCGRCHTMEPELKAYKVSPHRDVACGECHVKPGVAGWVQAKTKGAKQLYEITTGDYPRPILPPDHSQLPAVKLTCMKCHKLDEINRQGGPVRLVLRLRYESDEQNTRQQVAVVVRPAGLGADSASDPVLGVHWHVQQKVTFTSSDERAQKIDLVNVERLDGTTDTYLSRSKVTMTSNVTDDLARVRQTEKLRIMDCLDCHNRVGHSVPDAGRAVDDAIASGQISSGLPFIKRDAVALLSADYPSVKAADRAIEGLRETYKARYPLVLKMGAAAVTDAIGQLERTYRLVATPEMKAGVSTYPNNLGHQGSPGCFRCHDNAHFLVVKGKVTSQRIPSTCATCHTFPQVGVKAKGVLLGGQPSSHNVPAFVFSHARLVSSLNPAGTSCGTCHVRSYCQNCHASGAIKVNHTVMLYSHASAARISGVQACAYCHQPNYCSTCHKGAQILSKPP